MKKSILFAGLGAAICATKLFKRNKKEMTFNDENYVPFDEDDDMDYDDLVVMDKDIRKETKKESQTKNIEDALHDYAKQKIFDAAQLQFIKEGLEKGLDVSIYADPKYHCAQMYEIKQGLISGVDVKIYADPTLSPSTMMGIRNYLENEKDNTLD